MLAKIRATGGPPFNLSRAIHRKEHLDEIDDQLRGQGPLPLGRDPHVGVR